MMISEKIGPFGPVYRQFVGKPQEAIKFLMQQKNGEAFGALHHRDVGIISIVYGNDSYGIKKIFERHHEVLEKIQEYLEEMSIIKEKSGSNRIRFESKIHYAVVSRDFLGQQYNPWLLTAFEKKNSVLDNTMDTGETPEGERNDTATPQDTVSWRKISASSSDIETEPVGKQNGTAPLQNSTPVVSANKGSK